MRRRSPRLPPLRRSPQSRRSPCPYSSTPQFYGARPYWGDDGGERRRQWREWRRARDEARIAEAARREASRVEQERKQRWAWRRAMRERQYGYGPAYGYGFQRG